MRTNASAVPDESSSCPGPIARAPSADAWWSWPASVSSAPRSSGLTASDVSVPTGTPACTSGGISARVAPDHSSASSHQSRAATSSQPVRPASDSSTTTSPPSRRTTHPLTSKRIVASRLDGSCLRSQRCLVSENCPRRGFPAMPPNTSTPSRSARFATSSRSRSSCQAMTGASGFSLASVSMPDSPMLVTPTARTGTAAASAAALSASAAPRHRTSASIWVP